MMQVSHMLVGVTLLALLLPACYRTHNSEDRPGGFTNTDVLQTLLEAQSYDNRIYPGSYNKQKTTEVTVHLVVDSIDSVNEASMDFSIHFIITQEWHDRRLRIHKVIPAPKPVIELDSKMIKSVWVPDSYFANEKKAVLHDVTVPNVMMHLDEEGNVQFKSRVSLTAACPMNLQNFPLDSQKCSLVIRSFAYTRKMVYFTWREKNPVLARPFHLPQFRLTAMEATQCANESYIADEGDFSCIQVDFFLQRQIGYYMIQLYIPSILIVALSWVSFWLTIEAVPARVSLGILTVLTMTTQKSSAGVSLPKVSYVKAIDIWMAMCLLFVFAALLEYALVSVLSRRQRKRASRRHANPGDWNKNDNVTMIEDGRRDTTPHKPARMIVPLGIRQARILDKVSRTLFPLLFLSFCLVYWAYFTLA